MFNKLFLYFYTFPYIRPIQIKGHIVNLVKRVIYKRLGKYYLLCLKKNIPGSIEVRDSFHSISWTHHFCDGKHGMFTAEDILKNKFTFLNYTKVFGGKIEWDNPELTYLWDFNLHYFDYLSSLIEMAKKQPEKAVECHTKIKLLINEWIEENHLPEEPAWHPYPLSRRIISWIKCFINQPKFLTDKVKKSLYLQLLFLERNLETHLLGNHLLENGRALLFGGVFFKGLDAKRWARKGVDIVKQEIGEEILPNGGHFERSPMYHCLILEGLLDTYLILEQAGYNTDWLRRPLLKMSQWLELILCPDGSIPLFNDAALGISANPSELLKDAERIIGFRRTSNLPPVRDNDGYFVVAGNKFFCIIDGAPIGPDYNPGHAHADNLSYELFFKDRKIVVDSGTFAYDIDEFRLYTRGTAAHNTIQVDFKDQSEIWSSFRVARRAAVTCGFIREMPQGYIHVQGGHDGYKRLRQKIYHTRNVFKYKGLFLFWDHLSGKGECEVNNRIHLSPEISIYKSGKSFFLKMREKPLIKVEFFGEDIICKIEKGWYCPEFGRKERNYCIDFCGRVTLPFTMAYWFIPIEYNASFTLKPSFSETGTFKIDLLYRSEKVSFQGTKDVKVEFERHEITYNNTKISLSIG